MIDYSCFMSESVGTRGTRARHLFSRYLQHDTMAEGRGDYILKQLEEQNPWYVGFFFSFYYGIFQTFTKEFTTSPYVLIALLQQLSTHSQCLLSLPHFIKKKIPDIIALMSHFISYLLIWAVIGLCCYEWTFSSYGEQGLLSSGGVQASHGSDLSCCRVWALECMLQQLWHMGS